MKFMEREENVLSAAEAVEAAADESGAVGSSPSACPMRSSSPDSNIWRSVSAATWMQSRRRRIAEWIERMQPGGPQEAIARMHTPSLLSALQMRSADLAVESLPTSRSLSARASFTHIETKTRGM